MKCCQAFWTHLACLFVNSMGYNVGKSLVEEDMVQLADTLMKKAEEKGVKLILPTDVVLADKFANDANTAIASKSKDEETARD